MKHGWYYYYKIHRAKLERVQPDYPSLHQFLHKVRTSRPDHYFDGGPRSSQITLPNQPDPVNKEHLVTTMARMGNESDYYKDAHMNVQMFMLAYDKETVAMEVPVWLEEHEQESLQYIQGEGLLTGHIDLLRVEDDAVWVWDYKPNAHRERNAVTQTFLYAYMLSLRTNIPLENFKCGYFDEQNAYVYDPTSVDLPNTN